MGNGSRDDGIGMVELEKLNLFRWVDIVSVHGLLRACPVETVEKGSPLLEEGTSNAIMYMILDGRFGVYMDPPPHSELMAVLEPGETVGEMSVIDQKPVSATVIALENSRVMAVDEETFWLLVSASHAFAANLLTLLSNRMRLTNRNASRNIRLRRRFEQQATVDTLTGLHNRRWLNENLPRIVSRHERAGQPLSVIMIDVDDFKRYNDTWGHRAGDDALALVGRLLATRLRPTDLTARYGGEEFVAILPLTNASGACAAAERLRTAVSHESAVLGNGEGIRVSMGIVQLLEGETADDFLERSDTALYRAKAGGKNRWELDSRS